MEFRILLGSPGVPHETSSSDDATLKTCDGFHGITRSSRAATKLVFLAFSLRPSRLRGERAVPHSPPRHKERKEFANKNSFQAVKDLRLSLRISSEILSLIQ